MILLGHKCGELDPSRTPRASRKLSKRRAGTTCSGQDCRVGMAGFFDRELAPSYLPARQF